MSTLTIGCGVSDSDHPYEIIDAGFGARAVSGDELSWLDNETILFGGRLPEGYQPTDNSQEPNGIALQSWNYKTGERQVINENNAQIYCYDTGTLYLNKGLKGVFRTTLTTEQGHYRLEALERLEDQYFKSKPYPHCKVFTKTTSGLVDVDWVADLHAFDAQLRKSWREELSLQERNRRGDYIPTLVSARFPDGKPLPEIERGRVERYVAHTHQYLISKGKKGEQIEGYGTLRYRDRWLLSEDGSLEQLKLPGLWNTAQSVYHTRAGIAISARDMRKDNPSQADRGVFLLSHDGQEVTDLIHGISQSESVSPDGCKLAITHEPKILPLGKSKRTIKIINLCPQ